VEAQRQGACITENWQSLPDTADEARTVQRLMTGTVFEGPAATKAALLGVRRPHILHVATHAFLTDPACALPSPYARDSPLLRSGLALAGANRPGSPESSLLMAAEAATLDLEGTALVTLSACGSGRGAVARDEGILGLRRSLTIAGAQSQLVSLWKVDGPATARFMGEFYARLAAGKGRARALRESQEALATTPAFAAPFFWAAFALIGDPGPIVRRAR
jgi:CHAT domain-containing protein